MLKEYFFTNIVRNLWVLFKSWKSKP